MSMIANIATLSRIANPTQSPTANYPSFATHHPKNVGVHDDGRISFMHTLLADLST